MRRALALLTALCVLALSGCHAGKDTSTAASDSDGSVTVEKQAFIEFGSQIKSSGITVSTADGSSLKSGTVSGKSYWQMSFGSDRDVLNFKLNDSFLTNISKCDLIFIFEYFGNSENPFVFSYTSASAKKNGVIAQNYALGSEGNWSGKCIRVSDFKAGSGLDGNNFRIQLGTSLKQMWISSVRVVAVDKMIVTYPQIVKTKYDTNSYVVADANVSYYGAVGDGETDDTIAFDTAIDAVAQKGGGTVFVPAGTYKLTASLTIPNGVTLMGDFSAPDGGKVKGTILKAYTPTTDSGNTTSFIQMMAGSSLKGMVIWYPEQTLAGGKATAYPYTVEMMEQQGITVENLYLVNSYNGIKMGSNINALETIRNIYGCTLNMGMYIDYNVDIARFENINFSPNWWLNSGLSGAPDKASLSAWMLENSTAFRLDRIDWSYISDFTANGYKIGIHLGQTENGSGNGQMYKLNITDCNTCIYAEYNNYYGYEITNSTLKANGGKEPVALRLGDNYINSITCHTVTLASSGNYAVEMNGTGSLTMQDCQVQLTSSSGKFGVMDRQGKLAISNTAFSGSGKHVYVGSSAGSASFVNCMTSSTFRLTCDMDSSRLSVKYDAADKDAKLTSPVTSYAVKAAKPASAKLFNAADYGVKPDSGDVSAQLQAAIDAASKAGGGIVYVPYGIYRLDKKVTVKSGVEVRGSCDNPHHTKNVATAFFTAYGKNDPDGDALFTLQSNSGLRGFTVFYDQQTTDKIVPYAYTIRGNGSNVYVVNVTLSYTYQGIDFKTNRCDNHYIESIGLGALKTGIAVGGGSKGGIVRDVQANIHYIGDNTFKGAARDNDVVLNYTHNHLEGFVVSSTTAETMFNNFIFGALHGLAVYDNADAYVIGHGTDSGIKGVYINSNSSKALNFVNTQIVNIGDGDKNYILVDSGFSGTANFYNTDIWGQPSNAVVIKNGTVNLCSGTFFECGDAGVLTMGGNTTVSGLYFGSRSLADCYAREGTKSLRAFGNNFTYEKQISGDVGVTLQGADSK